MPSYIKDSSLKLRGLAMNVKDHSASFFFITMFIANTNWWYEFLNTLIFPPGLLTNGLLRWASWLVSKAQPLPLLVFILNRKDLNLFVKQNVQADIDELLLLVLIVVAANISSFKLIGVLSWYTVRKRSKNTNRLN